MVFTSVNPATGEVIKTFTPLTAEEVERKLALAAEAFESYRLSSFEYRRERLYRLAEILNQDCDKWASLITLEMGKPINQAKAEIQKCALVCRYYADKGEEFLSPYTVETDASYSYVTYQPLGVILAVMPWNFPFWQVFRFAAPALMAGNVALLKHASNVPQCSLAIEELITLAGFPPGVFQSLLIPAEMVEEILRDKRVKAVTLTGSELAGRKVAAVAGEELKKSVLELGGSDPFIVMPSANLEEAVEVATTARMLNSGQSCIAAKRFILHSAIAGEFLARLTDRYQRLKVGNPFEEDTDIGPLATPAILATLAQQVEKTVAMGAKVLMGGKALEGKGNFYPPTILTDIPPNSPAMREEFFGPVALIFTVNSFQEAIELANSTDFGLGASIWTTEEEEMEKAIRDIEAGAVFINGLVKSDPRLPFGGIKHSGYGRELGREGILEFVNIKTVWRK
ncbi:MAG: NAD-dependent succinate-semialdehyde dehydrogenase [Geminocystis sp.]|nr:NAD-dependent succinate-semialdehyde dehydrogenase [Geminocystis sp.]MCS7147934.1 NAD-dependent succinate-semialdehyde dehydrogenase [Geminocystis sp.]MCX8078761.1 NAD-dependent succinate-semialdehyde dehydrogenase [Geminocystis sp.]MDW8116871.1 NAD-dependent succinate-semialdehyde dehydrogenase [Geminocystis sp.]MDW8462483.1 NAD-dependent succinate-semialdehyde dehydrogenase [Geminocystis sp.]